MPADIFKFWSQMEWGETIHPADTDVFGRMAPERHGFKLQCLPACFAGPLKTAPVVMLYLSPGYAPRHDLATHKGTCDEYWRRWKGNQPLPDGEGPGAKWFRARTRLFGDYDMVREKIAVLNIGAYHSKNMGSYASMLALPSSRTALDWAQRVLFPQAEKKERIVICMRSHAYWGLEAEKIYDGHLFSPRTTRSGYLVESRKTHQGIIKLVRDRLRS
jgi:hypothetical protein